MLMRGHLSGDSDVVATKSARKRNVLCVVEFPDAPNGSLGLVVDQEGYVSLTWSDDPTNFEGETRLVGMIIPDTDGRLSFLPCSEAMSDSH
jgi:hypothetical protein